MSNAPPVGHNGYFSFEQRSDLPPDLPKLHYFKCYHQDLLDDLLKMPLEERGFYITALLTMYKEMEALPADDKMASLTMGGAMDIRQYRRMKQKLIERGLMYIRPSGRVSNRRFEAEICEYVTEFKNRREAAIEREAKKRLAPVAERSFGGLPPEVRQKSGRSPGEVREKSPGSPAEVHGDFSKNINKNNEATTTRHTTSGPQADHETPPRARVTIVRLSSSIGESESNPQTQHLEQTLSETKISDDVQRKRIVYSADFEKFWGAYPDRTNNSKVNAWQVWQKLSPDDRHLAIASLSAFGAFCRSKPDYPVIHAERYLKHRRFESHGQTAGIQTAVQWWHDPNKVAAISPERWRKAITQHANGIWPVEKLGPPPGDARCVVPVPLLTELRLAELYDETGRRRDGTHGMLA